MKVESSGAGRDRGCLRDREGEIGSRRHASLDPERRARLQCRREADDRPGHADARDRPGDDHDAERRRDEAEVGDREQREAEPDDPHVTDAPQHRRRADAPGDRPDPLDRGEDAEERGFSPSAWMTEKISVSLKPITSSATRDSDHDLAQRQGLPNVAQARRSPRGRSGARAVRASPRARACARERRRTPRRSPSRAPRPRRRRTPVEPGARERRDDPQTFARGGERAVRIREQLLRQHDLQQRGAGGEEHGSERRRTRTRRRRSATRRCGGGRAGARARTRRSTQSDAIISGRRRTRSASRPPSGAASAPAREDEEVSPASALDPVSDFIQTARTMIIARSPNGRQRLPRKQQPRVAIGERAAASDLRGRP